MAARASDRRTWTATANESGQFRLAALPKGRYQITVSSPGFGKADRTVTFDGRARARLKVRLNVASVSETVEVAGAAVTLSTDTAMVAPVSRLRGEGFGFANGAATELNEMRLPRPVAGPQAIAGLAIYGRTAWSWRSSIGACRCTGCNSIPKASPPSTVSEF